MLLLIRQTLVIIAAVLSLASLAQASTTISNISVSGTMVANASCAWSVPTALDFGSKSNGTYYELPFTITVTCTNGVDYSFTAPANTPVEIGPDTNYLSVLNDTNMNLSDWPIGMQSTGTTRPYSVKVQLHGSISLNTPVPASSVGVYSASVPITLSF